MAMIPFALAAQNQQPDGPQLFNIGPFNDGSSPFAALPMTGAAASGQTTADARRARYAATRAGLDTRLSQLDAEQAKLQGDPDYSKLSAQMKERAGTFLPTALAAAALGMGPEAMKPLSQVLAQQAGQTLQPMKIEGGQIDASGNVMIDEGYRRAKTLEVLRDRINKLEQMKLAATSAEDKADLQEMEQQARQMYQQATLAIQQGNQELRRFQIESTNANNAANLAVRRELADFRMAGGNQKLKPAGVTPRGEPVSYDQGTGQNMVFRDGRLQPLPAGELYMSQSHMDKQAAGVQQIVGTHSTLASLEQMVAANPKAFGGAATLAAISPELLRPRLLSRLTPEEQKTRQLVVSQAADILHQLYGAAQTMGEYDRAAEFLVTTKDNAETVMRKLQSGMRWQEMKLRQHNPQLVARVQAVNSGAGAAPAAPAPAPAPAAPAGAKTGASYLNAVKQGQPTP